MRRGRSKKLEGRNIHVRIRGGAFGASAWVRGASAFLVVLVLLSASCGGGGGAQNKDSDPDEAEEGQVKKGVKPEPDAEVAVIDVRDYGKIIVELYPNVAPQMVERFKTLARAGFYDGTTFHRVEPPTPVNPGVIQGGDPNSKDDDPDNDGMGQSDYDDLPSEFSDLPYELGTVGAARSGAPDSANCQFFISLGRNAGWDGRYTAFGRVVQGINDVKIISNAPTGPGSTNPEPKVVIRSITIQPRANK